MIVEQASIGASVVGADWSGCVDELSRADGMDADVVIRVEVVLSLRSSGTFVAHGRDLRFGVEEVACGHFEENRRLRA